MACLLEQQGVTQLCVVLLDPILTQIGKSITEQDEQAVLQILKAHAEEDYPADYVKRVLRAAPYEHKLARQPIGGPLTHSRVVLCKALRQDPRNAQVRQYASFHSQTAPRMESNSMRLRWRCIGLITLIGRSSKTRLSPRSETLLAVRQVI